MTKAKLVILRHGQTEHNKLSLMTGQMDVPLTAFGEEQACAAGALISHIRLDKVYSSNLSRAFNTAALVVESSGTQVHLLNEDGTWQIERRCELAEMDTGTFTGRNHQTDPEVTRWKRNYCTPLPGGESEEQMVGRVQQFFDNEVLPRLLRGENVMLVAHAGILRIFGIVLGIDEVPSETIWTTKQHVANAAPVIYEYEDGVITGYSMIDNPKEIKAADRDIPPVHSKKHEPKL